MKRIREDGNDSADDQEDGDQGHSNPQSDDKPSHERRLACPFRKHDPFTYSIHNHKICALSPWPSIARLK